MYNYIKFMCITLFFRGMKKGLRYNYFNKLLMNSLQIINNNKSYKSPK